MDDDKKGEGEMEGLLYQIDQVREDLEEILRKLGYGDEIESMKDEREE